jgi:DNA-binding transcriptional ArsR family regulator
MQGQTDVFHAIADPKRRRLLDLLAAGERSVQDLAAHFDITVQGVSQHLQLLVAAGLVARRKQGRFRFYRARPRELRRVHAWVSRYERFWTDRLDRLGEFLDGENDGP